MQGGIRRAAELSAIVQRCAVTLQSRIYWLAFEGKYAKHAFVHASQRFIPHETLEGLDAERELSQCKGAFY